MLRYVARLSERLTHFELLDSLGEPLILLALLAVGGSASVSHASSFSWTALNGQFNDSANWDQKGVIDLDGVPDANDLVTFRRGSIVAYTITFPGTGHGAGSPVDYVTDQLRVGNNNVSFADGNSTVFPFLPVPSTYTVDNPTTAETGRGIIVGETAADTTAVLTTRLATLSAVAATIGDAAGSNGTLNVNGGAFKVTGSDPANIELIVGRGGTGAMNVSGGADVSVTKDAALGEYTGSTGTASISGSSSTWTNGGDLSVGYSGHGTLSVTNGGHISNTYGLIGNQSGSEGTATVTGSGSMWTNSATLYVGEMGTGTLNVTSGAQVSSSSSIVGGSSVSSTGTVSVAGSGSEWTTFFHLYVGESGTGNINVTAGAHVSNGPSIIGGFNGSAGTVSVDGVGSTWTNIGNLGVGDEGNGTLNITNTGQVNGSIAYVGENAGATGTVNITAGGQLSDTSAYVGFFSGSTGMASVDGAGSKWTSDGDLYVGFNGTGTLSVANSGTVQATNVNVGALGEVHGNGFITGNVQNGGLVSPGNSRAALTITGSYTQIAAGKLLIELAGTTPGTQYDQLLITGGATLDGTLDVSLLGGFTPSAGNSFDVLTTNSGITGTFAIQQLPLLAGGLVWSLNYGPNDVILSVGGVLGDYNHNGVVDAADYVVWRKGLGTIYAPNDYDVWRAHFGQTAGSGSGASVTTGVPEPTSALLMTLATAGWCLHRRRTV